ncbi:Glycosyltransferase involved in cell wall bisynthesis [Peptoclostridium litorale DSM 5388]|uniref:Putative glycosyltransferase n=1 Tax=Peptoclostridium litorale DSM 5388 TaxID=1121324 RepID=A0A069RKC6_PEPLI|nr:glycosyltransferase family A protein [Peptoclostridium litorale]KDR94652.1 putative glycosyltransferase [Peptoclostridium litorale DSM 5388]SIO30253.1 Glycosyltransferase involved in cell wall bisynthesis [Peptoclostridium litorale DSM 5388]
MSEFAIIITAYNRPRALKNLLDSLVNIRYDKQIKIVISIDNNGTEEVNRIANEFVWTYGDKEVIIHNHKLGLRNHFIWVGDQTKKYENVIFLEDDLIVSPEMVDFSSKAIEYYKDKRDVAGICLYNPILCEFNGCKFYQNQDGYDVYFLQHPYWGNVWSKEKWDDFKDWLPSYAHNPDIIPKAVSNWKESSFKKVYIQYLVETNKYIVVPRISLVTNNGEAGLHNADGLYQYQTVLMNESTDYRFCDFNSSKANYDVYMEITTEILKKYNSDLGQYDFEVDLKGNRHQYTKEYVLTTRPTNNKLMTFSSLMKPMENGVIYKSKGEGITLCKAEDVIIDNNYDDSRLFVDVDMNYHVRIKTAILMLKAALLKRIRRIF